MNEESRQASFVACAYTDVGQRNHNEDAFLINFDVGLMLVADGVGGHEAGEVASDITCAIIEQEILAGADLAHSIRTANVEVKLAVDQSRGRAGMASTVVACKLSGLDYDLAWVGDSRAYLWDGQLKLLTRDHSLVEVMLARGEITWEQARDYPRKNVIVQAIGLHHDDELQIGINHGRLGAGQLLLLCSDGLTDVLDSARIAAVLDSSSSVDDRGKALVRDALEAGGRDNVTVVLVASDPGGADVPGPGREPELIWSYDPRSGDYHGLPEPVRVNESPTAGRGVKRVTPRAKDATRVKTVEATQEPQEKAAGKPQRRRHILLLAILAVIALSLFYSLDLEGFG